jgi:hypothetical protein
VGAGACASGAINDMQVLISKTAATTEPPSTSNGDHEIEGPWERRGLGARSVGMWFPVAMLTITE